MSKHFKQPHNFQLRYIWFFLYMFVGTQLAWGMRPFVGGSNEFAWYRTLNGNVYSSLYHLIVDA
jgi:hypothetical protein